MWKFKDNPPFTDGVEFDYGETKSMSFRVQADGDGLEEGVYANDITIKPGEKNLGAYQAPIIVGDPDYIGMPGGFLDIEKTVDKDIIYPNEPTTLTYTVTLENVDIIPVRIKSISDWLPSTGYEEPAFAYVENSTTANITHVDETITEVPMPDTYPDAKNILSQKWKGASDELRWELKWNLENHEGARFDPIFLQPGEVLTWEFDTTVQSGNPGLTFNELLWDVDIESYLEEKITLYSFPTAGTLVPMYDLEAETLSSILSTNAWLGKGDKITPKSQHWKKHK